MLLFVEAHKTMTKSQVTQQDDEPRTSSSGAKFSFRAFVFLHSLVENDRGLSKDIPGWEASRRSVLRRCNVPCQNPGQSLEHLIHACALGITLSRASEVVP
jgi:hypothetical protein